MADMYQNGTGELIYDGNQRLSVVAQQLILLLNRYQDGQGFYREDSESISDEDIRTAILKATHPEFLIGTHDDSDIYGVDKGGFLQLLKSIGVVLAPCYQNLFGEDYVQPLDVVMSITKDTESNLRGVAYEEAMTCSRMRPGEFGGYGCYVTDKVSLHTNTADASRFGAPLDRALRGEGDETPENVLARMLSTVLDTVNDLDVRKQLARCLLTGVALATVEDAIVNHPGADETKEELQHVGQ